MTNQELKECFFKKSKVKVNVSGKWLTGYYINAITYKFNSKGKIIVVGELVEDNKMVNSILIKPAEDVEVDI